MELDLGANVMGSVDDRYLLKGPGGIPRSFIEEVYRGVRQLHPIPTGEFQAVPPFFFWTWGRRRVVRDGALTTRPAGSVMGAEVGARG